MRWGGSERPPGKTFDPSRDGNRETRPFDSGSTSPDQPGCRAAPLMPQERARTELYPKRMVYFDRGSRDAEGRVVVFHSGGVSLFSNVKKKTAPLPGAPSLQSEP